jgi:hypothetical protein
VAGVALATVALGLEAGTPAPRPQVGPSPARLTLVPQLPRADARALAPRPPARAQRRSARSPARPVRVIIPVIGVRAAIVPLGLNRDRTLQTPRNFAQAGVWAGGPRPGAPGAAVIVGHVDSQRGPAVFYALRSLRRGDGITIVGADGRSQRFVVQRLAAFAKARFPTRLVYGRTRRPRLRLITCGGTFDAATGHYRDNTIVFARPR